MLVVTSAVPGHASTGAVEDEVVPEAACTSPVTLAERYVPSRRATIRLRYSSACKKYWANAQLDSYSSSHPAGCDGVEIRIRVQSGQSYPDGVLVLDTKTKSDVSAGCSGSSTIVIVTAGVNRSSSLVAGRACVGLYEGVPSIAWTCTSWQYA